MISKSLITALIAALCVVGPASIETSHQAFGSTQDQKQDQDEALFSLDLSEGIHFKEFIELYARMTDQNVIYNARLFQNRTLNGVGKMKFKRVDAESVFQTFFKMNEMAIVHNGPKHLRMVTIEDVSTANTLKSNAAYISLAELKNYDRPAEVVSVLMPLTNLPCENAERALRHLVQDHRSSLVSAVPQSNAVVIVGFSSGVSIMAKLLTELDAEAGTERAGEWRRYRLAMERERAKAASEKPSEKKSR
ncbi:MAG: hypothetical protein V3W41_18175 [Planctomycetota bacterium]